MKKRLVLITTILLVIAILPLEAFATSGSFSVQVVNKAGTYDAFSMIAINTNTSSGSDSCKYKGLSETDEIYIDELEYPEAEISDIEQQLQVLKVKEAELKKALGNKQSQLNGLEEK